MGEQCQNPSAFTLEEVTEVIDLNTIRAASSCCNFLDTVPYATLCCAILWNTHRAYNTVFTAHTKQLVLCMCCA